MKRQPLFYIFISAICFGISPPFAKTLLVADISPIALAGLLYTGAFLGLSLYSLGRRSLSPRSDVTRASLQGKDIPWLAAATLFGGIIAPICLMFGLSRTSGFSTSLLLNLEGVATAVIAVLFFKENAGKRLWWALACMTLAGIFLGWDANRGEFNVTGPLLIALSMACWGIDNNVTRHIAARDPIQIALVKGLFAGTTSLSLAYLLGVGIPWNLNTIKALLLGAFSYGVSLVFFIKALEGLGSFRTGLFFSLAPFIGAVASLILLREWIGWVMFPAAALMITGLWLMVEEEHSHLHVHEEATHAHLHTHDDLHHHHDHDGATDKSHVHEHTHQAEFHAHAHWPDTHHRHVHKA
ncbi:MAG: DMT family transporter [Deltaproteobacteria bacterium]|nr:DMT family transporter [Deltaproteobacteria bacterium]